MKKTKKMKKKKTKKMKKKKTKKMKKKKKKISLKQEPVTTKVLPIYNVCRLNDGSRVLFDPSS